MNERADEKSVKWGGGDKADSLCHYCKRVIKVSISIHQKYFGELFRRFEYIQNVNFPVSMANLIHF